MSNEWQAMIGLEIHAQLLTDSKLFSPDSARFSDQENIHIHPVSVGLPGVLPVLNKKAVEYAVQVGLALNCRINNRSIFARKNYFYPDLPKGYQISQYEQPLCEKGYIEFEQEGIKKTVRIHRVHIEEDAGRFHHQAGCSLVNFNRSGVPLVEIVSEPDMRSPKEAGEMVRNLRRILRYLRVCDGNLEEGSLRCDCNVSVNKASDRRPGTRAEIKNVNSFKFIEKAIEYEIQRQIHILSQGESVIQETRLYDSSQNKTFSLRSKETASDYRYFPDPDLPPLIVSDEWIAQQKQKLPEFSLEKAKRFQKEYQLSKQEALVITEEQARADYFETIVKTCSAEPKISANWLINEVLARLNEDKKPIEKSPVSAQDLGEMVKMVSSKEISGKIGKKVFAVMWNTGKTARQVIAEQGLKKITDENILSSMIEEVIQQFPKQAEEYKQGKHKVFGFFVGAIMKKSKGQADPETVNQILKRKLQSQQ